MNEDMTMRELAAYLPKVMPVGQTFHVGDEVVVRLMKQPQLVQKGRIVTILRPLTNERLDELEINHDNKEDLCIKVEFEGQEDNEYPVWPFQDSLYRYEWVNEWAGQDVLHSEGTIDTKPNAARSKRLNHLFGRD